MSEWSKHKIRYLNGQKESVVNAASLNPQKAIRLKCLDCSSGSAKEVATCVCSDCPLYPFRFGKNPMRAKRVLSDDQRKVMADRLAKTRRPR